MNYLSEVGHPVLSMDMTYNGIAQKLTADGILSPGGKPKWNTSSVKSILSNEKYRGRTLLLKTYNADYLTKKRRSTRAKSRSTTWKTITVYKCGRFCTLLWAPNL